eukprot:scaffold10440_cov161-Skeletonema_dohrnii-CCMP3373.AAC.3
MAHAEQRGKGRSQPQVKDKVPPSAIQHLSSRFQRRLKKSKLPKQITTLQHPPKNVHVEKKKIDGFSKKNKSKLTVTTTESTCASSLSQNHSFEYQMSSFPSQQTRNSGIGSFSMDEESYASYGETPKAPDDVDLVSEWLQLYACSNTSSYTFDEADEQEEYRPNRKTNRHSDNEMINYDSPRDLLSENYSLASSNDTITPTNHRIPTPPEIASASCSFNFDLFGLSMLKSVGQSMSKIKAQIEEDSIVDDEYLDSCDDNSSCSANSY